MIKIQLTRQGVDRAIGKLDVIQDNLKYLQEDIIYELVTKGAEYANKTKASYKYKNSNETTYIQSRSGDKSGYIALVGKGAIYEEFGTGEKGLNNPNPGANNFSIPLHPFNSGAFVSTHINKKTGDHFWYYIPLSNTPGYGSNGYTTGIPSSKVMYNTAKYIEKNKKKIYKDKLKEAIAIGKK